MATILFLQGRRVVKAEDIASHFEISLRTVYRDIAALGEAGVPIQGEAGVGYSLMKGYHLPPVAFTTEEASALFTSGKLVAHLTDASLHKQMEGALMKIRSVLPRDHQDYLDRLDRSTEVVNGSINPVPRLAAETLIPVQRAIANKHTLAIEYHGGKNGEVTRRNVEPLGLLYYADNWHLIAYCRLRKDFRDFRTDRIRKLQLSGERFAGHEDFSLKEYLETSRDSEKLPTARVWFESTAMERARNEWSWGLVEELQEKDGFLTTLLVHSEEWLAAWLLSFGTAVRIISPASLQGLVLQKAEKVMRLYSETARKSPSKRPVRQVRPSLNS
jgi:predicted DNA-binding transcriptional regulator YafY